MKNIPSEKIALSPDILRLIVNLEKQLEEQKVQIQKMETKTAQLEKNFRILVSELIHAGCINVPERRKMIKRSMINHEALISLLKKKGVINSREFLKEIKQLIQKEKPMKKE
jgi:ribosomal protein L17